MSVAKHQLDGFFSRIAFPIDVEDLKVDRNGARVSALRISVPAIGYSRDWATESRLWVSDPTSESNDFSLPNVTPVKASDPIQYLGVAIVAEILVTAQGQFKLAAHASAETPAMAYVQACVAFLTATVPQQLTGPYASGISAYGVGEVRKHFDPFMRWLDAWANEARIVQSDRVPHASADGAPDNRSALSSVTKSPTSLVPQGEMTFEQFKVSFGSTSSREALGYAMNQAEANWFLASEANLHAYYVKWLSEPRPATAREPRPSPRAGSPYTPQSTWALPAPQLDFSRTPGRVGGFILTILGIFFVTVPLICLPLSITGLVQSVRARNRIPPGAPGRGLTIAGVTIGIVAISLTSLLMLAAISGALLNNS
ncbi:DUF4190 domain-containing protein [Cryobacterium arcticum]|uniref:DUF4190 domain-containing protein n=1 Tax=Cryobacterium arcticum TaxID=670052 RepID=A0A1B1BK19_9MICO|nr:DUF4190 domain-containing protein [Cryobacterium arcticum]ANP73019.1 hypothetical protein PA27867_2067 [Cryobacterium arcticum]